MNKSELNKIRKALVLQRQEVLEDLNRHGVANTGTAGALADEADRAEKIAESVVEHQLGYTESKLLEKIDFALQRIDEGGYGICEECGGEISMARLEAKPSVSLCIDCQSAKEKLA